MFVRLSEEQLSQKIDFIKNYIGASNAANGSFVDANANVTTKNGATLLSELHKDINIQIQRKMICDELKNLYGEDIAKEYIIQLKKHIIYSHDESGAVLPYCVAISLYPYLLNGLTELGSDSKAPKHLKSYCDGVVQLVFSLSANFVGAVAIAEFLNFFDYFARKDYGENYLQTNEQEIKECLQGFVYQINHPAASRGFQSSFTNISIFDKYFFDSLFHNFVFPDNTSPNWNTFRDLQLYFLRWFNKERTKAVLTFPVVTVTLISDKNEPKDKEFALEIAKEMEEGNSFFLYQSESTDSLSSCCRLRSKIQDNTFHMSIGATGVMTGSIKVITLNMNRFLQDCKKKHSRNKDIGFMDFVKAELRLQIKKMHYFHVAFRNIIKQMIDGKILQAYTAGFIKLDRQYSTIGINGMVEGAEALGYVPNNNQDYISFVSELLEVIKNENKDSLQEYGFRFNTEFVPGENLGVKNAYYDKLDGYQTKRDCYNSYFYPVEDDSINVLDKFILHGREMTENLDGGSALHLNLEEHLSKEQYFQLMCVAIKTGCPYWTINVKATVCNSCGRIDKDTLQKCSYCGSKDVDYATRIIGYLKRISNFSSARQREESQRYYHYEKRT